MVGPRDAIGLMGMALAYHSCIYRRDLGFGPIQDDSLFAAGPYQRYKCKQ